MYQACSVAWLSVAYALERSCAVRLNLYFVLSDLGFLGFKGSPSTALSVARCRYALIVSSLPSAMRDDVFYVVKSEGLPVKPRHAPRASIVCIGKPSKGWIESGSLVYTETPVSEIEVANALAELFDKYQTWENDLSAALAQGMPLEKLGAYSTAVLGNPIIAQSPSYEVFFYELPQASETELYRDYYNEVYLQHTGGDEELTVPKQPATLFNQDPNFSLLERATEPVVFSTDAWRELSSSGLSFRSMLLNCYSEGEAMARLIVDEVARPFQDKDHILIKTLGEYFKRGLFAEGALRHEKQTQFGRICEQLATGQSVPHKKVEALLEKMGWDEHGEYFCVVLRERELMHSFSAVARMALSLTAHNPAMRYHFFNGRCLIVCNISAGGQTRGETIARIEDELAGTGAIATFSSSFSDFMMLEHFYRQALIVERVGRERDSSEAFYRFEDYLADYAIAKCSEGSICEALIPDCLKTLAAHDREKGTKLTLLLREYLDNNGNIAKTTRSLFLHRNTFLYQLEKTKELIGVDLDDADVRLGLQIALRAMRASGTEPLGL